MKSYIRQIMHDQKRTLRWLSDSTGLSYQTVFRATKDATIETLTLATLAKIAHALRVPLKSLFDE